MDRNYQETSRACESRSIAGGHSLPEMTRAESECVRRTACAELEVRGICAAVQKNGPRGNWKFWSENNVDGVTSDDSGTFDHLPVCVEAKVHPRMILPMHSASCSGVQTRMSIPILRSLPAVCRLYWGCAS